MRFRKKPIEIEALLFTGENFDEIDDFVTGNAVQRIHNTLRIHTNHGFAIATIGDYIIRSQYDEFYPCSQREFEANYEPIPDKL